MRLGSPARKLGGLVAIAATIAAGSGCQSAGERAKLIQQAESLRVANERLERAVAQRDGSIARLSQQIQTLTTLGPDRPVALFAPTSIEIASLTGGASYDDIPGDDGVTVHLRPKDVDGDAVKAPGRVVIQLSDNCELGKPRVLGVYTFDAPDVLRRCWHGRFGTNHYTFKCPFAPGVSPPPCRQVHVDVQFTDFLTGKTLATSATVPFAFADDE